VSQLVGIGVLFGAAPRDGDARLSPRWFTIEKEYKETYTNAYWPLSGFVGDMAIDVSMLIARTYEEEEPTAGTSSRFAVVGVIKDKFLTPVSGATVKLFRTATDEKVSEGTTDGGGNYVLDTQFYPDTHWVKAKKVGVPDQQGVTVDTLIGQ
jgi:hypothetical protein